MSYTKKELIQYRIDRAWEAFEEAKVLAHDKYWNTVVNRLYYSCYYMISALLAERDLNAKTHAGLKIAFNQHFVKENKIDVNSGKFFSSLFNKRQEGDYQDFQHFDEQTVLPLIEETNHFLKRIEEIIDLEKN